MQCYTKLENFNINLSCSFRLLQSFRVKQKVQSIGYLLSRKKTLRTIHFKGKFGSLFFESNIIQLPEKISFENALFVSKSLNNQLHEIFNNWLAFSSDRYRSQPSCREKGMLKVKSFNMKSYGKEAIA